MIWSSATVFHPVGANTGFIGAVATCVLRGQGGVPYPSLHLPCVNAKGVPTNTTAAIAIGEMLRIARFAFIEQQCKGLLA